MLDPWTWDGIVETKDSIFKVTIDTAAGVGEELARMQRIQNSDIVSKAATARSAMALLGFARFPVTRIEGMQFGYRVTFIDFRFYNEMNQTSFAAQVELDQSLNMVRENLGFNRRIEEAGR
jgi:hypothetical protein